MPGGQGAAGVVSVVEDEGELAEPVLAVRPGGGRPHLLDGHQQQADEDGDDGDDDQQLDQGEGTATVDHVSPAGGLCRDRHRRSRAIRTAEAAATAAASRSQTYVGVGLAHSTPTGSGRPSAVSRNSSSPTLRLTDRS